MNPTLQLPADLDGRRAACAGSRQAPFSEHRDEPFRAQLRASTIERDGKQFHQLDGVASVVDTWYQMYDIFGPYEEKIAVGAFDATLAADPDVAFLLNHRGMTMARTRSNTLQLFLAEDGSLGTRAFLNPQRQDVQDLVIAVEDGNIDQMSFAFRIKDGHWNQDYSTYTIDEVDLHRGDVSAVNFGANPYTSISARAKLAYLERVPGQSRAAALKAPTGFAAATLRNSLVD